VVSKKLPNTSVSQLYLKEKEKEKQDILRGEIENWDCVDSDGDSEKELEIIIKGSIMIEEEVEGDGDIAE
jgi:hypothetical protein